MSKITGNLSPRKLLFVYAALAVITAAAFWQVRTFEFISLDDDVYVTDNAHVQEGLIPGSIGWAFTTMEAEFWHPLTWLTLIADYELHGLDAGGYHAANLVFHVLSTLLLFWLFQRMTGALWPSVFVAALFGVHPLHVESVAWIAERKDVLSGFFWMLTLCFYVRYTEKPVLSRYIPVMLGFICGLMSKSIVVTLPVILILLDYWPLGRLRNRLVAAPEILEKPKSAHEPEKNRKAAKKRTDPIVSEPDVTLKKIEPSLWLVPVWQIREKAPLFILSLIFVGLTLHAQDALKVDTWPLWSRIANAFVSYLNYAVHVLYPFDLGAFYPFELNLPVWKIAFGIGAFCLISAAVILAACRFPPLVVGWSWYVATLAPVIGLIQVGKHAWADRYSYLSSIGITVMLAWGVPLLFKNESLRKKVLAPAAVAFGVIIFLLTWRQVGFWQNSVVLYERALKVTDRNALAHYNLANVLENSGRSEEAKTHYREAIRIRPDSDSVRVNLGAVLAKEGNYEEAIALYKEAIRLNPHNELAYCNLGSAYFDRGRLAEAAGQYLKAIELNPNYADAHFNYANLLIRQGRVEAAIPRYLRTVELSPGHAEARHALADLLAGQNQTAAAIIHYLELVKIKPEDFRVLNNLGVNLDKQMRYPEAIDYYRRALSVQPDDLGVHFNLAGALVRTGDIGAARGHFQRVLELKPDFAPARQALKFLDSKVPRREN